ncbi:hypothetical protein A0H81_14590 [Grifola frondosa]|uniref:Uncharacterized protein n=1 Tax=Grifola frondosa TaxID=5627 RepID=A0A1C7LL59_GRIFR|nr:hypothetical protein A0H81_14590 [Grifola frondosa]
MLVCKAMEIECAKLREDGYGLRDEIVRLSQMNMQLGDKACADTSRRSEEKDIKPSHDFVSPDRAQSSSGDQFPDSGPYPSTIKEEQSPPQDAEPSPITERDAEVATVLAEAQEERKRRQKAERELALMKEMFSQLVSERCVDSVSPFSPINGMSSFINSAWLPNALAATGGLNTTSDASQMRVDQVRRDSIDRAAVKQNEMPVNIVLPPDQADNLSSTKPADSPDEFMQWISPPPGLIDLTMDSPMQLTSALPPLFRRVEDFDRKRESTSPAEATQPPPKRRRMVSDSISDQDGAGDTDKNSRSDMLVEMPIALSIPITPSTEGQSHAVDGEDVDKTLVEGISPSLHADEGLPTGLCAPDPGGDAVSGGTDIVNDADAGKSNATDYPDPPVTEEMQVEEPVHEEPVHEEPVHEVDSPRPLKLSIRHINLVYEVSEDKMVCRLCLNRVRKLHLDLPVASFPRNAPWDEISGHSEQEVNHLTRYINYSWLIVALGIRFLGNVSGSDSCTVSRVFVAKERARYMI